MPKVMKIVLKWKMKMTKEQEDKIKQLKEEIKNLQIWVNWLLKIFRGD